MPTCSNFILARAKIVYKKLWQFIWSSIVVIIFANIFVPNSRNVVHAEYFSSVDELPKLEHVEMGLIKAFRHYLQEKEKEFQTFRNYIDYVKLQHSIAEKDFEDYLGNPINAFTLIRRLVTDWTNLQGFVNNSLVSAAFSQTFERLKREHQLSTDNELKGAVKSIIRLQKVYKLIAEDLAEGKVNRVQTNTKLTWHDCFEIGTNLFDLKEYPFALTWLETTLRQLKKSQSDKDDAYQRRFEIETLEYLALTANEMGNPEKAVEYIDKIIQLNPDHHTKDMRTYLNDSPRRSLPKYGQAIYFNNYTRLCRGIQIPQKIFQRLKCRVETRGNPHFMLAPLKVEEMYEDPPINLYHNVLSDIQINEIIKQAEGKFFRSMVSNEKGSVVYDGRISQQTWLDYESPVMKFVSHIVSQISGLDLSNVELTQVANYGIGGTYEPHHDYFGALYNESWPGDRIATNMFYLSDVEEGGYTVFPLINVFSRPKKGSMILWYNLHKSLEEDPLTYHAGCPVIIGSKRIANIWVHSGYQEFRRPCGLVNDNI